MNNSLCDLLCGRQQPQVDLLRQQSPTQFVDYNCTTLPIQNEDCRVPWQFNTYVCDDNLQYQQQAVTFCHYDYQPNGYVSQCVDVNYRQRHYDDDQTQPRVVEYSRVRVSRRSRSLSRRHRHDDNSSRCQRRHRHSISSDSVRRHRRRTGDSEYRYRTSERHRRTRRRPRRYSSSSTCSSQGSRSSTVSLSLCLSVVSGELMWHT